MTDNNRCRYCKGKKIVLDEPTNKTRPCFYCKGTGEDCGPSLIDRLFGEAKPPKAAKQ